MLEEKAHSIDATDSWVYLLKLSLSNTIDKKAKQSGAAGPDQTKDETNTPEFCRAQGFIHHAPH